MKKFLIIMMLLSVLVSCCACSTEQGTEQTPETTQPGTIEPTEGQEALQKDPTPEELYGHINQLEPISGVYKIWSEVGVQNMADHPDGKFELLCDVDMQGAALRPIGNAEQPFTGEIKGTNYTISNFVINESNGGYMGFVGYNKGFIRDLKLDGFTITADANTKYLGSIAGYSEARITRNNFTGTVIAKEGAEGILCGAGVGCNNAEFTNTNLYVDLQVETAGAATVGGITGQLLSGKVEYIEMFGSIDVAGDNKTAGLLVGTIAPEAKVEYSAFVGERNNLNGELFIQLAANATQTSFANCAYRDNTPVVIPENELKLRQTVADAMLELCTIEWRVRENLVHNEGSFTPDYTYYGMPYRHMGASLERMKYLMDDEGYLNEIAYSVPGFELQNYIGNDCSTGLIQALWKVSNTVDFGHCQRQFPGRTGVEAGGCLPVGDWAWEEDLGIWDTMPYVEATGEQEIYECYGQLKMGDFYFYMIPEIGGHTRMAGENAVVVRNQDGTIDPNRSYVVTHEQGYTTTDMELMTTTTCRANHKYTFANLYYDGALPVTCEELITGEMEPGTCELIDGDVDGKMGMITGVIKTNYYLDYVDIVITDDAGNEVLKHRTFPAVGRTNDSSDFTRRFFIDKFDLARLSTVLSTVKYEPGVTYSYEITATDAPGVTYPVKEGTFVQGGTAES